MSLANLPDAQLLDVAKNVWSVIKNAGAGVYPGITPDILDALASYNDAFEVSLPAHVAQQAAAKAATATKNGDRGNEESQLRMIRNILKANGASEAAMAALGLPSESTKAPSTATVPRGAVDTSKRLQHLISWTDSSTPENKKRPVGTVGCEIWVKIDGPPPTDQSQCHYLSMDSATPYLAEYSGEDGGKTAHYMLRWKYRDGSTSAFGETISATITA